MRPPGELRFVPLAVIPGIGHADRIDVYEPLPQNGSDDAAFAMQLLADGVPLRLLLDLAAPNGPDSEVIAASEETGSR